MKHIFIAVFTGIVCFAQNPQYPWLGEDNLVNDKVKDITCLSGYSRVQTDSNSFAEWLRNLPLKNKSEKVRLFDNSLKLNQKAHYRIIDIDRGQKDLQQCADAVIRLRAEWLYYLKEFDEIQFYFTSGDRVKFTDWIGGLRPKIVNNNVNWINTGTQGSDYSTFKKYLESIFTYSGSYSLKKELEYVSDVRKIKIGDVFIQGGFPGHAVIVIDQSVNSQTGKIALLLAQSYMPAQDIHILKNINNCNINPWYIIKNEKKLYTPEWTFEWSDVYRFE